MPGKDDDDDIDLDAEEEKEFGERFNKFFHKAMGEREKRFKKDFLKEVDTSLTAKFDELKTLMKGDPADPEKQKDGTPAPGGGAKLSPETEAMIRQAQKDAKEAKDAAEKWKKEAEAEKALSRKAEERTQLTTMLQGKVKPSMLEMVVDQLHAKSIIRDEDSGVILWKDADGATLPLKDGITSWAKSDVGKEFAPAREVRGNGSRGPSGDDVPSKPGSMTLEGLGDIVGASMGR